MGFLSALGKIGSFAAAPFTGGTSLLIGAGIQAGTSILGAKIGSNAAKNAASTQADAAKREGEIRLNAANQSNAFLGQEAGNAFTRLNEGRSNALGLSQPYQALGDQSANTLASMTGPGGSLITPETFQAPTDVTQANDPGFQFRLDQGRQALERSAAAHGTLLTGGTAKSLVDYGQNAASAEYQNVYNRARDQFDLRAKGQADTFGRLSGLAAQGQQQAQYGGQVETGTANSLANLGMGYAQQYGTNMAMGANAQGNAVTGAANATAAGTIGSANQWTGALNNIGLNASQLAQLNALGFLRDPNAPPRTQYSGPMTGHNPIGSLFQ